MEAEFVALVSAVGCAISIYMVVDAHKDIRLVVEEDKPHLLPHARHRLINEVARLTIQVMFLVAGIIYAADRLTFIRDAAFLLLISVPAVIAGWSFYSYRTRRSWIKD